MDKSPKKSNNDYIVIEGDGEQLKIKKSDMVWNRTGDHQHHYKPDFSDETDTYIAMQCTVANCVHGRLFKKDETKMENGQSFTEWLEISRKSLTPQ